MSENAREDALQFLRSNPMSYMATVEGDTPWNRAMFTVRAEDDFTLWYCTMVSSNKVRQIANNPKVCITVWEGSRTCRVFGMASLVSDPEAKKNLWDDNWERYFSGGKDDPEYTLIQVKPSGIEYQDVEKYGHGMVSIL